MQGFLFSIRNRNEIDVPVLCSGLEEEGLYRVVGVNSKVSKLTNLLLGELHLD